MDNGRWMMNNGQWTMKRLFSIVNRQLKNHQLLIIKIWKIL